MRRAWTAIAVAASLSAAPAAALETDQFFAWGRPLADASAAIDDRINEEMREALEHPSPAHLRIRTCAEAERAIEDRLRHALISTPEAWIVNTSSIERIPGGGADDDEYRRTDVYSGAPPLDPVRLMPMSPTIEIDGVRLGTDKISHFFNDGAMIWGVYRRAARRGDPPAESVAKAVRYGIRMERTVLGTSTSGIFSLADLEANYQGMMFYRQLCEGDAPELVFTPAGWRVGRPFDIRGYVTPEWDESWQPNIYASRRWASVKGVMERHCAELRDPEVARRRADYAARDRETPTEREVLALVAAGKLDDPIRFSIDAVCGTGVLRALTPKGSPADSSR